jgi:isochorismate hydrolase
MVVTDAVGDRDAAIHKANLFDIAAKTATLASEAETLAYLKGLKA